MPLYEYRCTACGYSFEKIQSFSAEPERECPKCQGVLIRPVTAPALRFAGAGWYVNDYAAKGAAKSSDGDSGAGSSEASSSESAKPAETKSASTESGTSATPAAASTPAASSSPAPSPSK